MELLRQWGDILIGAHFEGLISHEDFNIMWEDATSFKKYADADSQRTAQLHLHRRFGAAIKRQSTRAL